jgi:BASS family bile acid:Na+ symporter
MSAAELVSLTLKTSIMLHVFALGLNASFKDATYLARNRGLLVRSLLAMNVIMPLFAAAVAWWFDFHPAIEIAIIVLALSPVPPALPTMQTTAGGSASYAISMLVAAALFAIVIVPAGVELLGNESRITPDRVARIVLTTILVPLFTGLIFRRFFPELARRIARPAAAIATVLLVLGVLPVLFVEWPLMKLLIGQGNLWVLALFTLVGLGVGHWLGGPVAHDRTVLALATARRHPAMALAVAGTDFPNEKAVLAVVCWHLVIGAMLSVPYVLWRRRGKSLG